MTAIDVKTSPDPARWAKELGRLPRQFDDWRKAWRTLAPVVKQGHKSAFSSKGQTIGSPWPAGDPEYMARKGNRAQLVLTGGLAADVRRGQTAIDKDSLAVTVRHKAIRPLHSRGYRLVGWSASMRRGALRVLSEFVGRHLEAASRRAS